METDVRQDDEENDGNNSAMEKGSEQHAQTHSAIGTHTTSMENPSTRGESAVRTGR